MYMAKMLFVTTVLLAAVLPPASSSCGDSRWNFYCAGGNFTPCSHYSTNLEAVAAELPEKAATSALLFANETCGQLEAAVHAVAQCRGDTGSSKCKKCVTRSFEDARKVCPFRQGALVFRDECTLGYYTRDLLVSQDDTSVDVTASKIDEFPVSIHSVSFDSAIVELANGVAQSTAASARRFATGQKGFAGAEFDAKIYALAQCLPSMSAADCGSCIAALFDMVLTQNMTAGRGATVWCSFRFSPQKFFTGNPMLDLPVNGSSPPTKEDKRHKHISVLAWIAIALGSAALLAIVGLATIYWCTKTRRNEALAADEGGNQVDERGNQVERRKGKPVAAASAAG